MAERAEVVVVGLGAIGSATCCALARAGVDVIGLEQFELGHARGASHDHSRIIRRSYHTPGYVQLAGAAYEAWDRVPPINADEPLVVRTGGIDLFPRAAAIPIADYTHSMGAAGIPFEVLDAAEIMRRWPQWHLAADVVGLYQPTPASARPNARPRRYAREPRPTARACSARPRCSQSPTRAQASSSLRTRVRSAPIAW